MRQFFSIQAFFEAIHVEMYFKHIEVICRTPENMLDA